MSECAPPVLLTGPTLGGLVAALLSVTTFLYLNHDRENKEWTSASAARAGHWPPPSADFNWCEPDYVYTPWIAEVWNTVTSLLFLVGPLLLWSESRDWSVRLNLLLVVAIGLGSAAFHATLQYEMQLMDELPMIMYIAHTVALLSRRDVTCPRVLWACGLALSVLLLATAREDAAHKVGRALMVLGFSGCFIWLAFSLAPLCSELDQRGGGGYVHTRHYQSAALAVLVAILSWVTDNLGCSALHSLPFGLPYPQVMDGSGRTRDLCSTGKRLTLNAPRLVRGVRQLHALAWHTGMSYVCGSLCRAVVAKQQHRARAVASAQSE
jgi:hypothetical protein